VAWQSAEIINTGDMTHSSSRGFAALGLTCRCAAATVHLEPLVDPRARVVSAGEHGTAGSTESLDNTSVIRVSQEIAYDVQEAADT
jgi:hypothetical protein